MLKLFNVSWEVQSALEKNLPVVALESTIISHGMPYPDNIKMALDVEELIREEGAIPATIAILDGKICVGLDERQIERVATEENVIKASIRDLPGVLAKKQTGATTVATTAYAAHQVGIRFFATGGLGGVHRGVADTLDISADLPALTKCNLCIVSAGVKLILDIPKTLEYMEMLGIPVYGYETNKYPGFYIRDSGYAVEPIDADQLVNLLKMKNQLHFPQAVQVAVPIPEEAEMNPELIERIIDESLFEANEKGIIGKDITPFLLSQIKERTGGESLKSNIALMKNNARIAAKLAVQYFSA